MYRLLNHESLIFFAIWKQKEIDTAISSHVQTKMVRKVENFISFGTFFQFFSFAIRLTQSFSDFQKKLKENANGYLPLKHNKNTTKI